VEVAHAEWTAPKALSQVLGFLGDIGKIAVPLRNSPGFIVPRIQVAAMNEAVRIVEEGVAGAAEVDTAIKSGFGFRLVVLGLMEFIDLGGLDILAHAGAYLSDTLGKDHFRPPASVQDKMAAGELGPRTGRGYYDYGGVDTAALFRDRYRAFADLLTHVSASPHMSFFGGVEVRSGHHADQEERL
jgi:3-hydroxybutyryl-CoA dehydrogenase